MALSNMLSRIPMLRMFYSATRALIDVRLSWFTKLKRKTLPLLWRGPPALAHPTHRRHLYLGEKMQLNCMQNVCLWSSWRQKDSPWSLKKVLGLNSCGSSPSVSSQTSRNWSTLPWMDEEVIEESFTNSECEVSGNKSNSSQSIYPYISHSSSLSPER